ncbi:coiled-coil domain-containing protein 173-like [Megalops cyprinoides]|uniref:coiled-coil domain-containing protein 173-like n=1 Tax=Megalops cyprinoides TaxID=118141 RepID=UPI0018643A0C|nr:coiled-coil domain-containing protein 173-like [Megalops cyprinoides]
MEQDSLSSLPCGRTNGPLGQRRAEALAKATSREFYQSERVKQFHCALLLTETLKEREEQIELKQKMQDAANEETKKFMAEIRRREMEAVEQERQKVRQREADKMAVAEYVKQQLREQELMRKLRKLEKEREIEECQQLRKKYEREKMMMQKQQQEEKRNARKAHREHLSARDAVRAKEEEKYRQAEERRRQVDAENESRMRKRMEEDAERHWQIQKHKDTMAERLAAQLQEQASKEEERTARAIAVSLAKREAELERERKEKAEKKAAMLSAIAAIRESKRKEEEQRARDEKRNARDAFHARQEEARTFAEEQQRQAQKKKDERGSMDSVLRRQMAERCAKSRRLKKEDKEFDSRNVHLLAAEEEQFQQYATGVIEAAAEAKRNTFPLHKIVRQGPQVGLGPLFGGMRASYLAPGSSHSQMTNYITSTNEDINRLYGKPDKPALAASSRRLDFIW